MWPDLAKFRRFRSTSGTGNFEWSPLPFYCGSEIDLHQNFHFLSPSLSPPTFTYEGATITPSTKLKVWTRRMSVGRNVSWTNPDESRILANLGRLNRKMSYYDILHVALLPQKPKGWLNSQDMEHLSTWRWSLTSVVFWAEVVAQLVEQLLPEPEVRSSNPDIDKVILNIVYCIEKTKNRKGSWEWSIYK